MNKKEVRAALEDSHERLTEAIEGLSEAEMVEPGAAGDWSIKDLLAHLSRWEAEVVKLLWQAQQGLRPTGLLTSDESTDAVNARWQQEDQDRPLERILQDFHGVREQTLRRLEHFTDKDLVDPNRYPWLEGKPLWEWIAPDSFGHDLEHLRDIKRPFSGR